MKYHETCTMMCYFFRKYVNNELKKYRGVVSWKITYGFKKWLKELDSIFRQVVESNLR